MIRSNEPTDRPPPSIPLAPNQNHILASLSRDDKDRLAAHLVRVRLVPGQPLLEAGADMHDVVFVETGLVSLVSREFADSAPSALAMIGPEGAVGLLEGFSGAASALATAIAMVAGTALRMNYTMFTRRVAEMSGLREAGGRAVQDLLQQIMQTSACNARDTLLQRCIRWLLLASERLAGADVPVTHDVLAAMLGVRRSGVTVAIAGLQQRKLIEAGRGRIRVLDHPGLQALAGAARTSQAASPSNGATPAGRVPHETAAVQDKA